LAENRIQIRAFTGVLLGVMGSLILFGLLLALVWRLAPSSSSIKLIGLFLSSGLAVLAGGFIFAWQGRFGGLVSPAVFGFSLGGFSAAYILGLTLPALGLASCAAVVVSLGALLYRRLAGDRQSAGIG
jgi:hypothetical protein